MLVTNIYFGEAKTKMILLYIEGQGSMYGYVSMYDMYSVYTHVVSLSSTQNLCMYRCTNARYVTYASNLHTEYIFVLRRLSLVEMLPLAPVY